MIYYRQRQTLAKLIVRMHQTAQPGFANKNERVFHMKQKFIPLEKQSKRKQKERHAAQRRDWGNINPVTRKVENAKAYNRKKSKRWWCEYEQPRLDFFICVNAGR